MTETAHRVVVVGFEQAALMDVACVSDTLDAANMRGADPRDDVLLGSLRGRSVLSSSGIVLLGDIAVERLREPIGTLVVGGFGHRGTDKRTELVRQVGRLAGLSSRVASVRDGAAALAEAGLLDGRQPTAKGAAAR